MSPMGTPRKLSVEPGQRFGRLTVLDPEVRKIRSNGRVDRAARCCCDCGTEVTVELTNLLRNNTRSCGCLRPDTRQEAKQRSARRNTCSRCGKPMFRQARSAEMPICADCRTTRLRRGQRFGRLKVINPDVPDPRKGRFASCRCDCGNVVTVKITVLTAEGRQRTRSCGCLARDVRSKIMRRVSRKYKAESHAAQRRFWAEAPADHPRREQARALSHVHGLARHPLYITWWGMISRCEDPKAISYRNYGGRGIAVYPEWHDVREFIAWIETNLGPRPEGKHPSGRYIWTLDRIDVNGNYEPGNVKWATPSEQNANRRPMIGRELADVPDTAMWCPTCGEPAKNERDFDRHYRREHAKQAATR